ncbi:uncharacterized protein EMH_0000030 [Eimeria mitis]|uniref:Uncharacterized protein n=1 Tax=Eimeria mitis TaxID=44415 RepID=U6K8Y6_9EIME|nr:uncharacterized protein EMH_0000030 [Eimeria mitis]CDJ34394.1 hypothetical protein EMH_0000030 [Eimeria mitis]
MMKLGPSQIFGRLGAVALLAAAFFPLSLSANPATLLAVRQVLPSQVILPEDIRVVRRGEGFFFEDAEITGTVPDGTAVLKFGEENEADRLRLYVINSTKADLESVVAGPGLPVFCDFRAYRQCFTRPSETAVEYLQHSAVLTTGSGAELVYLRYPSGGSILTRHSGVNLPAPSDVHGQFTGEVDTSVLKCSPFGAVEFPSQFDPTSLSIIDRTEGDLQFCEVMPPLVTGKQAVAITGTKRAPRIYCEKASRRLLYFDSFMQTSDVNLPHSQPLELKLTGQPATCDMLTENEDPVFSVKLFDPVLGKLRGEKSFSYISVGGRKAFVPVRVQAFPESALGSPCSSRNYRLLYQRNNILHTEIQHDAPLECHKLTLSPLGDFEREALLMKIHGSNLWMEVPVGTVLALPVEEKSEETFKLYSYQPTFSTSHLHVTELHAMAGDTELGPAVISTAEPPNGGSAAMLYQQSNGKTVSIGYLQDGVFVGGPNVTFFTPDALNGGKILEYRVHQMQRGSSLLLSSVPEALALQRKFLARPKFLLEVSAQDSGDCRQELGVHLRFKDEWICFLGDIIHYNTAPHGIPAIGRAAEDMLSMLHRLRNHFSSRAEGQGLAEALSEISNKISRGPFSVVLRLPINMLDSPTSKGLIQQLRIALSLMVEDTTALHRVLANRITFYGTAIYTLYKILQSGHCNSCPEGNTECNFCRAVMFRDFVYVTIQGLGINRETMPDSLSWAEFRGQDFLAFAETSTGSALLGVEMDFHTDMLTKRPSSQRHLPQLRAYATTCLNAHISGMILRERSNSSQCPGLHSYLKNIIQTAPVEDFAALMNGAEFRDAVVESCNGD